MSDNHNRSAIAAVNPFFGVVNFLVLALPLGWRIYAEKLPPSIDGIKRIGDVKWVTEGRSVSIISGPGLDGVIDINIFRGRRLNRSRGKMFRVNGHEAYYSLGEKLKGLFRKYRVEWLEVIFYCDRTNRTVKINIICRDIKSYVGELIGELEYSICH